MSEGDIVYYESARCLHGRMQPLQGSYYVNLFAHYRPVGEKEWFLKPNPPNSPLPLLDIGSCSQQSEGETCAHNLPFLSQKTNSKVDSSEDLMRWWIATSPPKSNVQVAKIAQIKASRARTERRRKNGAFLTDREVRIYFVDLLLHLSVYFIKNTHVYTHKYLSYFISLYSRRQKMEEATYIATQSDEL